MEGWALCKVCQSSLAREVLDTIWRWVMLAKEHVLDEKVLAIQSRSCGGECGGRDSSPPLSSQSNEQALARSGLRGSPATQSSITK